MGPAPPARAAVRQQAHERTLQWALVLLTGFCAGFMAFAINAGIEAMDWVRFKLLLQFVAPGGSLGLAWLAFNGLSCALAMVAGIGVAFISPLAAGSGIPHIKAYCNGADPPGLLTFKTLMVKAVGAMFSIGSGLIAGKEGPFIQCGACIAAVLLNWSVWVIQSASQNSASSKQAASSDALDRSRKDLTQGATKDTDIVQAASSVTRSALITNEPVNSSTSTVRKTRHAQDPRPQCPAVQDVGDNKYTACSVHQEQQAKTQERTASSIACQQIPDCGDHLRPPSQPQADLAWQQQQQAWRHTRLKQDQAAMGAGAGVAAAFIAPLAGAAYSIEEASTRYSGNLLTQAFCTGGVVVMFMWLLSSATTHSTAALGQLMYSSPLSLAYRGSTGTDTRFWWYIWELPLVVFIGVLGGLLMVLWTWANTRLQLLRKQLFRGRSKAWKVVDVMVCVLITNTIRLLAARHSPCLPLPPAQDMRLLEQQVAGWRFFNSPIGLYPQLWCPPATYSVYGQLFLQPLDVAVRSLFSFQPSYNHSEVLNTPSTLAAISTDRTSMPAQHVAAMDAAEEVFVFRTEALAAYTAFVWGMLLISYGITAPTGIFIPSLAIGAAGGRLTGQLLRRALRSTGVMLPVCMPGWSVLGAASILVGCTRLALANILIVLESSGAVPMVVPMVLLMVPAKLVSDALFTGIYDWQVEDAGYAFLEGADMLHCRQRAMLATCRATVALETGSQLLGSSKSACSNGNTGHQPGAPPHSPVSVAAADSRASPGPDWVASQDPQQPVDAVGPVASVGVPCTEAEAAHEPPHHQQQQQQQQHQMQGSEGDTRHPSPGDAVLTVAPGTAEVTELHSSTAAPSVADRTGPAGMGTAGAAVCLQTSSSMSQVGSCGLLLTPDSSLGLAYEVVRHLGLEQVPVVAGPHHNTGGADSSSGSQLCSCTKDAGALLQEGPSKSSKQVVTQHHTQSARLSAGRAPVEHHSHSGNAVLGYLTRKGILVALKHKLD